MSGKPLTAQQAMAVACRDSSLIVSSPSCALLNPYRASDIRPEYVDTVVES